MASSGLVLTGNWEKHVLAHAKFTGNQHGFFLQFHMTTNISLSFKKEKSTGIKTCL